LTVDNEGIAIHDKVTFREPTLIRKKKEIKGKYIKPNFEVWLGKALLILKFVRYICHC